MNDENKTSTTAQKRTMYFILGLPVALVVVIIGIGTFAQWGEIRPRWQEKEAAETVAPAPDGATTNAVSIGTESD